jgi:hypothetical protein
VVSRGVTAADPTESSARLRSKVEPNAYVERV